MIHKLRNFRQQNKLSLAALAAMVGVSKATISRIEHGIQAPRLGLMFRLVDATHGAVSPGDFQPCSTAMTSKAPAGTHPPQDANS
jgi:transcriptional regulator with XRE-family HTH domain